MKFPRSAALRSLRFFGLLLGCSRGVVAQAPSSDSQPRLWSGKETVALFEATENEHLKLAQAAIEEVLALKGKRTVENTLAPFDRANDELQEAEEFANLVQNVHPDKAFRDNATAMVTKVS